MHSVGAGSNAPFPEAVHSQREVLQTRLLLLFPIQTTSYIADNTSSCFPVKYRTTLCVAAVLSCLQACLNCDSFSAGINTHWKCSHHSRAEHQIAPRNPITPEAKFPATGCSLKHQNPVLIRKQNSAVDWLRVCFFWFIISTSSTEQACRSTSSERLLSAMISTSSVTTEAPLSAQGEWIVLFFSRLAQYSEFSIGSITDLNTLILIQRFNEFLLSGVNYSTSCETR